MSNKSSTETCKLEFKYDKDEPTNFIIYVPEKLRKIYNVKGTVADHKQFIFSPQEMHKEGIIIGTIPSTINSELADTDKMNFDVVLFPDKKIIHTIAGSLITSNPEIEKIRILGLVFCFNIQNIEVSNTTKQDKYKMADKGPKGEPNYPCMLKLDILQ